MRPDQSRVLHLSCFHMEIFPLGNILPVQKLNCMCVQSGCLSALPTWSHSDCAHARQGYLERCCHEKESAHYVHYQYQRAILKMTRNPQHLKKIRQVICFIISLPLSNRHVHCSKETACSFVCACTLFVLGHLSTLLLS